MPGSAWPQWIPSDGREDPEMEIQGCPCLPGTLASSLTARGSGDGSFGIYQPHFTGGEARARLSQEQTQPGPGRSC